MTKCLQINLNCCKAAQALLLQTAAETSIDFVFASEFNRPEGPNWYTDTNKAAIINVKRVGVDNLGVSEPGFRWIEAGGRRLYSCYWSPNSPYADYLDFLYRLEARSVRCEVLVAGDLDAHHSD